MVRTRPTWNEQFLEIAYVVAKRATCLRRGFGAVIVNPKTHQIISTGYCGNASGIKDCIDLGKC